MHRRKRRSITSPATSPTTSVRWGSASTPSPGAIKTHALSTVLTPEIEERMVARTPLGRLGEPADIAYAALFLCAPAAGWISGQVLTVSGGGVQELD